jgi:hypothetical protein
VEGDLEMRCNVERYAYVNTPSAQAGLASGEDIGDFKYSELPTVITKYVRQRRSKVDHEGATCKTLRDETAIAVLGSVLINAVDLRVRP